MDVADDVGPREAQQLVVALHILVEVLEAFAPVRRFVELEALDHGAHGAIEDGDALFEDGRQGLGTGEGGGGVHRVDCMKRPRPHAGQGHVMADNTRP